MNPIAKRTISALTTAALVVLAIIYAPTSWIKPVVTVLAGLAFFEFSLLLQRKTSSLTLRWFVLGVFGCLVILTGLTSLSVIAIRHGNLMMLYIIAIIKISDMGGFAFGVSSAKLMKGGNHKLCPSISPGKSWEGLFGSVFCSSVVSCAFIGVTHFGVGKAILFGVTAALVGTAGDLVESKFKRWVGVKDSSTMKLTNGMGGILDMLDSLLFAPAVLMTMICP